MSNDELPPEAYEDDAVATDGLVPPHDLDAEAAVLSAMILTPREIPRVRVVLSAQDFFADAHELLAGVLFDMDERGQPIDLATVGHELRERQQMQRVGGVRWLGNLVDATPAVANVLVHAALVLKLAQRRRAIAVMQRRAAEGYGAFDGNQQKWLESVASELGDIAADRSGERPRRAGEAVDMVRKRLWDALQRGDAITGTPTGISGLDQVTAGLHPDLVLITGRIKRKKKTTGVGKSSLALNAIGLNVAKCGGGVAVFSLEEPMDRLGARLAATVGRIDASKLRRPADMTVDDQSAFDGARAFINDLPIWIDDRKELGYQQIRAASHWVASELKRDGFELKLIIVDNLQVAHCPTNRNTNETQAMSNFGKQLVGLARETGACVMLVCQLNTQGRIKGCTAIEEHAQWWFHVVRDENATLIDDDDVQGATIEIRKARDEKDVGAVPVYWHGKHLLFSESSYL